MELIIEKLDLPCDLKKEIYTYCYNELGYTIDELNIIKPFFEKPEIIVWWKTFSTPVLYRYDNIIRYS